jgi:hypothetical protein
MSWENCPTERRDRMSTFEVSKNGRFLIPTVLSHKGAAVTLVVNWPLPVKK